MLARDDVARLLDLQAKAYALLMWLSDEGLREPARLSPAVVAALRAPGSALAWLEAERARIPAAHLPAAIDAPFANLLSSFFATSFDVDHLDFGDRLVDARLRLGAGKDDGAGHVGLDQTLALACKHLASSDGVTLLEQDAGRIVRRASVREAALVWTYVWELDRRARKKGKGPVVHKIWRSLSWEVKRALTVDRVWEARAALLAASRALVAAR